MFEVQEWCICGGWTNTWTTYENDKEVPSRFDNEADAWYELESFFHDMQEEFEEGNLPDVPDREDFRIVEVAE
jgi:hypothetical protein